MSERVAWWSDSEIILERRNIIGSGGNTRHFEGMSIKAKNPSN